ncbi:uncharacterized protein TNCV_3962701 [Trichonephila clavipes]|nr:uncharacterized protein TNCV_3962701 [Trichonephila clavipes]
MRVRAYCAHPSIRDHWVLRCRSRCPDQMVSLKRDSQCLSPQASLVLMYRPTAISMKGTGEYFPPLQFTCRNCGGGDRGVAIYRPFGEVSLSLNRTVTCMVLKANDRRTSCPCHDEFRGPRSDYVRQVALATTQQQQHVLKTIQ